MALFDFCHNSVCWIVSDKTITDSYVEYRMKNRMNRLHAVWLEPNIIDKMDVKLLYVTVLDFSNILHAYLVADVLPIHILVVCPC